MKYHRTESGMRDPLAAALLLLLALAFSIGACLCLWVGFIIQGLLLALFAAIKLGWAGYCSEYLEADR